MGLIKFISGLSARCFIPMLYWIASTEISFRSVEAPNGLRDHPEATSDSTAACNSHPEKARPTTDRRTPAGARAVIEMPEFSWRSPGAAIPRVLTFGALPTVHECRSGTSHPRRESMWARGWSLTTCQIHLLVETSLSGWLCTTSAFRPMAGIRDSSSFLRSSPSSQCLS